MDVKDALLVMAALSGWIGSAVQFLGQRRATNIQQRQADAQQRTADARQRTADGEAAQTFTTNVLRRLADVEERGAAKDDRIEHLERQVRDLTERVEGLLRENASLRSELTRLGGDGGGYRPAFGM